MDLFLEVFYFVNGSEDYCNIMFGNDVVEIMGFDEVIWIIVDGIEEVICCEVIVEKIVVK